jgi:hypothetical protein
MSDDEGKRAADRFHAHMKSEFKRKRNEKAERNSAYVGVVLCALVPTFFVYLYARWYLPVLWAFLPLVFWVIYVDVSGMMLIIYTIHYYRSRGSGGD